MMFHHSGVAPKIMTLETLKEITNNFSKEQELGSGTFGIVYKGVKDGEEIAVKHLRTQGHDDHEKFKAEFENLWRLRHPNIVQLLGYCYEIKREAVPFNDGRLVWADNIYRALCFEYMHNGSLGNHLSDEYNGHDWQTRYKIIKGICDGLKYLHEGLNTPMYHLDLKPDNILLDKNMVPKLADFGLSKFIHNDQTQATQSYIGTRGYLPPEYILHNLVSNKFDIFSLGVVMIRIITGNENYFKKADMSSQQFINLVHEKWRSRIHATSGCTTPEAKCHQVRTCIQIALDCVDTDRAKRPTIGDIVRRLNELEPRISAAPARPQQTSVAEGPKDSDTDGVIVSKPGGVCFEIALARGEAAWSRRRSQMLDFNPKPANSEGKPVIPHTVGTLSSMEFSHGLTETDLCPSSATHVKKGLTKLQKATTKVLGKTRFQMPSPGFGKQLDELALELHFPLELNKGIQCHGILTDRCEEVNKIDGVSQISIDKEQGNVMVSGLMDSDSIVKKPNNKDANSQLKKLHPTRGAKGQPKDAGANDQKNGLCSKDAKTVLPQPTVQQPQQTQIKQLKAPQQPKLISPKEPFAVAVPVKKGPKSVEFNAPDVDTDDDSMFYGLSNIDDIPEEDSGEEHSIFDVFFENFDGLTLLDTNNAEEGFKTDGFSEPKMITKPLAMPLGANNGGDNNGANGGSEIQAQIKGNGNNAVKRVSSAKQNRGSCGGGRQMQNVNDVALGVMVGLAGFPGTCQTGGGSVDRPHTSSVQHGSGGVVVSAAMCMPVRGMPAPPEFYQQGGAAASTSMPTGQAMLQDAVAARKTMAARQQHMALAQQQQQPEVSRSKKMQ